MAEWNEKYAGWRPIFDSVGIKAEPEITRIRDGGPKILTVCQGGNSRSVACGFLLKYKYKIDAIACGWEKNSPQTLYMLCEWATVIILMQDSFRQFIDEDHQGKIRVIDVGHDRWANGCHPELLQLVDKQLSILVESL